MLNTILITLFASLFLIIEGGSAYAQIPPQGIHQDTPGVDAAPQPEIPKAMSTITVKDGRLSVELSNVTFGDIIQEIAKKTGTQIIGYSDTFSKQLTTKFDDLEIDRGFIRLFSLVKESNYLINYGPSGSISKLEIFGIRAVSSIPQTPARPQISPVRPQVRSPYDAAPPRPPISSPLPRVTRPVPQAPQAAQAPQPVSPDQIPENHDMGYEAPTGQDTPTEDVKEIPYIPPQRKPVYIPPIKR